MNKKIALFAIIGLFVAVFAVSAQSAGTTQPQPGSSSDTADMSKENKNVGTIEKIDPVAKTISVKLEKGGEVRIFSYDDKTSFMGKDEKATTFETLKVGDKVGIEADSANLATKIKIKQAEKSTEKQ